MLSKLKNTKSFISDKISTKLAKRKDEFVAPEDKYIVGLDIGTEFVKALVAKVEGDNIEIIGVGRQHQGLHDMQAGAVADIGAVVRNCDAALNEAEKQSGVSVRTAVIGIAGELVKGTTITVKCHRSDPTKQLDLAETEQIIQLVQERAQKRAKQQLSWELGGKEVEIRLVNSALVRIDIDGYKVTNPIGFQGKEVVVQLYTAFAPLVHIGALERVAQELDLDLVAVAAEPFAVARSVTGNEPSNNSDVILIDIGGGTTDVAVLNDGGVQGTKMFGIGGRAFTRNIERELGISFDQAEQLKVRLDTDDELTVAKRKEIVTALGKTLEVWVGGIELALSEFDSVENLPHRLLLCGGGSSLEMIVETLQQGSWYRDLSFSHKPVVQYIKPREVIGVRDSTGLVNDHTFITAMGLLRVGLDSLQTSDEQTDTGSIKQKLNRMLQI
ncbi:pilus assembly protein PilM [Candidatus Saccharibacteria bacterium]|nr:pilus assembly protein PilM [Candidatus Saccharibacteria bacterium]